jgi:glutamyl-tRNA(Gln) amidotransferase subunit E
MELFETVATRTKIQPSFIATILTETLKSLERDGVALENLVPEHIEKIFYLVDKGETAKESVEKIARWIAENPGKTPDEAMEKLSLRMLSEQELASIVDKVVFDNISLLKDQGDRAAGKMLGLVMAQVRGRADAKRVAALVKERARSTT